MGDSFATSSRAGVSTDRAPMPVCAYSQAVRCDRFLFVSGQVPIDPSSGKVPEEFSEQVRQTLDNVDAVARAAGARLVDAVRVGVYLADGANFEEMDTIYRSRFVDPLPARTTVVAGLRGFAVEIDAIIAITPGNRAMSGPR